MTARSKKKPKLRTAPLEGQQKANHEAERFGLIAEEVAEHMPEAVSRDGAGNPDGIDYSVIVAALVKTVQEQGAEIAALKEAITSG
jgi:hypothetical protein